MASFVRFIFFVHFQVGQAIFPSLLHKIEQEVIVVSTKREPELSKLWRHRPGRELVGMVEDVFAAKWQEKWRPLILKHAPTPNGHWMMVHLPASMTYAEFAKIAEAVSDYTKAVCTIERKGERITVEITRRNTDTYPFMVDGWKGMLPVPFGYTMAGKLIVKDIAEFPHMLVAGMPGMGKSNFLHVLANSLLLTRPIELYIIDLKVLEFSYLKDYATLATTPDEAVKVLKRASRVMTKRLHRLEKEQAVKIQEVKGMPHMVVIIDELAELSGCKEATEELNRLLRLGRAPGVSVICATQRPSSTIYRNFTDSRALFAATLCFWVRDDVNSEIILDNHAAAMLPKIEGRAIFQADIQEEIQVMHLPVGRENRKEILGRLENVIHRDRRSEG